MPGCYEVEVLGTQAAAYRTLADTALASRRAASLMVDQLRADERALTDRVEVLTLAATALTTLSHAVTAESVQAIESLVSYGLATVFEDQSIRFKLDIRQRGNVQIAEPRLVIGDVDAPILDAFGGGPACVVAFLLRVIVCQKLGLASVILLDESFAMVSMEYVDNVGRLLRELAEKMQMTFILVTHQREFLAAATHAYEAIQTHDGTMFAPVAR